jgi:hypothetical protein
MGWLAEMSQHNGIRNESSRDLFSAEPTTIQPVDGLLGGVNGIEFDIYFTLVIMSGKTCTTG